MGYTERSDVRIVELVLRELCQLGTLTRYQLQFFIARKYIDDAMRAAIEAIIALRDKVAAANARLQAIDKEVAEITKVRTACARTSKR